MPQNADDIYADLSDGLGQIVLNRPDSRNAISREMWLAIPDMLKSLQNGGAELIVIRGASRSFAAGADIMELKEIQDYESAKSNWEAIANALDFLYAFEIPVVAAIDGSCLGGGCLLACACDLRYASDRSTFSVPIAKLGIVLDDANLGRIAAMVGLSRAKELIYRARKINASQALDWGLISEVFPAEVFETYLQTAIAEIRENSLQSIVEAKASFARYSGFAQDPMNHATVISSYLSPDARARIKNALSKG